MHRRARGQRSKRAGLRARRHTARCLADPRSRCGRGSAKRVHGGVRSGARGTRHPHHHVQLSLHGTRAQDCPIVVRCSTRAIARSWTPCWRAANDRALHRRQIDGRTNCDPRRGRGCGAGARRPGPARISAASAGTPDRTPRRAPTRHPPAGADCSRQSRHVRHAAPNSTTCSPRCRRGRRSMSSKAAITRSKCQAGNRRQEPIIDDVQQTIAAWMAEASRNAAGNRPTARLKSGVHSWPPSNCNDDTFTPAARSRTSSAWSFCRRLPFVAFAAADERLRDRARVREADRSGGTSPPRAITPPWRMRSAARAP